jgi:hypothetical protein
VTPRIMTICNRLFARTVFTSRSLGSFARPEAAFRETGLVDAGWERAQ